MTKKHESRKTMPVSPAGIVVVLSIILITLAGCTESAPAVPSVITPPVTKIPHSYTPQITIPVTTILQPAATNQAVPIKNPVWIFNGEYHWVEYRINNTVTYVPGTRTQWEYVAKLERSYMVYKGIPAIHEKITQSGDSIDSKGDEMIIIKNGSQVTENMFFDKSAL